MINVIAAAFPRVSRSFITAALRVTRRSVRLIHLEPHGRGAHVAEMQPCARKHHSRLDVAACAG